MTQRLDEIDAANGELVPPDLIPVALTAGTFRLDDGAMQVFDPDGTTTYTEHGRPSEGTWYIEGPNFCSFWPPSFTGCYQVSWVVEADRIAGLRFADRVGTAEFVGRYIT